MTPGTLYIVATPIGNLEDITLRAMRVLKECDIVAAEDTRVTGNLLKHFGIEKKLTSYHEYNKEGKGDYLIELLLSGKNVAVVSDAGTPCISDSGWLLVDEAKKRGVNVAAVPGPSAVVAALSISGIDTDRFIFLGFLKKKPSKKRKELEIYKGSELPVVFFESPYRILDTLDDLKKVYGDCFVSLAREITKKFEEVVRGTPDEVKAHLKEGKVLGEFCVVVKQSEPEKEAEE